MATLSALVLAAIVAVAQAQSLNVVNSCSESVFLYTETSYGTVDNNVNVAAGQSANLGISSNWDGNVNVGKCVTPLLSFPLNRPTRYRMQQRRLYMYHRWPYLGR
jgi:hypothetical protein